MSESKAACEICADNLTDVVRKPIVCPYCAKTACKPCVERFLVENTIQPKCMFCSTGWGMEFLRKTMTQSYIEKTYREHRIRTIEAEATADLPNLQEGARRLLNRERIDQEIISLKVELNKIKERIIMKQREKYRNERNQSVVSTASTPSRASLPCPDTGCHGIIIGSKCGMCDTRYCMKCLKPAPNRDTSDETPDTHVCNEEDVGTVAMLRQTHPCPKCRQGIYKTEGCDQMWCTVCHTCFSWRTGNILNGPVHNPHFYEYMRQHGGAAGDQLRRNVGDIPCGGMPTYKQITTALHRYGRDNCPVIIVYHRMLNHIIGITMPIVHYKTIQRANIIRDAGVLFLCHRIDKEKWRRRLYLADLREESSNRQYALLEALTFNGSEVYRQFCGNALSYSDTLKSIQTLVDCYNEGIRAINKEFKQSHTLLSASITDMNLIH